MEKQYDVSDMPNNVDTQGMVGTVVHENSDPEYKAFVEFVTRFYGEKWVELGTETRHMFWLAWSSAWWQGWNYCKDRIIGGLIREYSS